MAEDLSSLGEDGLSRLVQVIETLEHSAFDFLELEVGGMRVALGKGDPATYATSLRSGSIERTAAPVPPAPQPPAPAAAAPVDRTGPVASDPVAPDPVAGDAGAAAGRASATARQAPQHVADEGAQDGTVEIPSPTMGMFYTHPQPGAPPYVSVGSVVQADTTVALLEVMKMFNAVSAGVEGTVVAVLAEDNQLVEYGQPLFRVRPV